MTLKQIISELEKMGRPEALPHMAKFGINTQNAFGVSVPNLRKLAKRIGLNHQLAHELWNTEIHDARLLACLVAEADKTTRSEMNNWAKQFYSWDVCDGFCNNLFVFTPHTYDKAIEWSKKKPEYFKRAGFVLMAVSAVHKKEWKNEKFISFFPLIKSESIDERNFVKKAVNWALRQIGKRSMLLNKEAITLAKEIQKLDSKSARWIANDALRELTSKEVIERIKNKAK
ncbi:DNA alkylation repair protein [Bacteroidota bacterium]